MWARLRFPTAYFRTRNKLFLLSFIVGNRDSNVCDMARRLFPIPRLFWTTCCWLSCIHPEGPLMLQAISIERYPPNLGLNVPALMSPTSPEQAPRTRSFPKRCIGSPGAFFVSLIQVGVAGASACGRPDDVGQDAPSRGFSAWNPIWVSSHREPHFLRWTLSLAYASFLFRRAAQLYHD